MGDTGPCGPCTEIHYDRIGGRNAAHLVNKDDPDVLEIWNNVFMQFQRQEDRSLKPLPALSVDTGMGFERLVSVIWDVRSNYDTPIFGDIFAEITRLTGCRAYTGKVGLKEDPESIDMAYRVVADHIRTLCVAIADGSGPGAVGRDYVVRRILRRAVRYWNEVLKAKKGTFTQLIPCVVKSLSFFTELAEKQSYITSVIAEEEARFERTLHRGTEQFNRIAAKVGKNKVVKAEEVWDLWSTFGFPIDLTELMAQEKGLEIDKKGVEALRNAPVADVKKAAKETVTLDVHATAHLQQKNVSPTDDQLKYDPKAPCRGKVVALVVGKDFVDHVKGGSKGQVGVVLDRTNFYAESGGQVADVGELQLVGSKEEDEPIQVRDTQRYAGFVVHSCVVPASIASLVVGTEVDCFVNLDRRAPCAANHTSTHILNHSLHKVLGDHVEQKGSLVDQDRARFDFSHRAPVTDEELVRIEDLSVAQINKDLAVDIQTVPLDKAKSINALRLLQGEAYPDPVRVVSIGRPISQLLDAPQEPSNLDYSVELCGGAHLSRTSEARLFVITQETGSSQGVRRINLVTGEGAERVLNNAKVARSMILECSKTDVKSGRFDALLGKIKDFVDSTALPARDVIEFRNILKEFGSKVLELRAQRTAKALERVKALATATSPFVVEELDCGADRNVLGKAVVDLREARPDLCFLLASRDDESAVIMTQSPKGHASVKAGDWAKHVILLCGGKGGGSAEAGQGTGSQPEKLTDALEEAKIWANGKK